MKKYFKFFPPKNAKIRKIRMKMRESISEKCAKIVDIPVYVIQRQPGGKRGEPQRYRGVALSVSRALHTFFVLVMYTIVKG